MTRFLKIAVIALLIAAPAAGLRAQEQEPEPQPNDEDIIIEAESDSGKYIRKRAPGVLKSDVPIMNTPQSVQIVPEQVYRDQQAQDLSEATRNVSNVTTLFPSVGVRDSLAIRGFQVTSMLIDGLPNITTSAGFARRELLMYERLEVLKGPASVTFGAIEPGGALNLVTKRPQGEARREVELSHGRWDNNAATADLTGPLNEDRTLLYRALGAFRSSLSYRDEVESERYFLAPSLSWLVTRDTTITLFGHYQRDSVVNDWGSPSIRDPYTVASRDVYSALVPDLIEQAYPASEAFPEEFRVDENIYTERFFGNENNNRNEQDQGSAGYLWETDFGNWVFQHRSQGESASTHEGLTYNLSTIEDDNRTVQRGFAKRAYYIGTYSTQFALSGELEDGSVTHRPHIGVDFTHTFYQVNISESYLDAGTNDIYLTESERAFVDNLAAPNLEFLWLHEFDKPINLASGQLLPVEQKLRANYGAVYGRHQVSFGDLLHVSAGARFDQVRGKIRDQNYGIREQLFFVPSIFPTLFTNPRERSLNGDFISPQGGVVLRPIKYVSIFASASESYNHDFSALTHGNLTPKPIRSVGYEGGLKFAFFDENLIATTTVFEITKTNVLIDDPLQANRLLQSGEQRHQGFEFDLLATPVEGLNMIASYGYIDAKITKDDTRDPETGRKLIEGKRPNLVPEHNANAWIVYELQGGPLRGLGFGGGVYHNSSRYATASNDLVLPEYTIGTGLIYYKIYDAKLSVTAKNITNKRYYESANSRNGIIEGRPFEVIVALNAKF